MVLVYNTGMSAIAELNINLVSANDALFSYLNDFAFRTEPLDQTIFFIAHYLPWVLLVGLLVFLFTHKHPGEAARSILVVLTAAGFAWVISYAIKYCFLSPRPFLAWPDINLIFESGGFDSFPSGHATFFMALGAALFAYHRIGGVFYVVAALAIGVARIISGIHWPLAVLAGWLLGGLIGYYAYKLYHLHFKNRFLQ